MKNQTFIRRLSFAINGIKHAFKTENSFRTQMIFAVFVPIILILLKVSFIWWAVTILTIALVLAAELFNTALEILIDHLHPEHHEKVKHIKDCAAGAVLMLSIASICIGLLVLYEHFII